MVSIDDGDEGAFGFSLVQQRVDVSIILDCIMGYLENSRQAHVTHSSTA